MQANNSATIALTTLGSLTINDNTSFTDTLTIHALNGGSINLSNITSVSSNDVLRFLIESSGNVDLTSLQTTTNVQFDIHIPGYALPALNTANGTQFIARSGNTITANALTDQSGGSVTLETNSIFNATTMQQFRNASLSAQGGADFNAPALTDVQGSTLTLDNTFTFTTSTLNNIDSARFFLSDGKVFGDVSDTSMNGTYSQSQTVLQADGAGTTLNLGSVQTMALNDNTSFTDTLTVRATNSGVINLANLTSASSNDILQFLIESGGNIQLTLLNTTTNARFDVDVPAYTLPALTTANNTTFDVGTGSTLDLPELTDQVGGAINLQSNAALNAVKLQAMQNTTFTAESGSTFNAPALTEISGTTLNLDPGFTFASGSLSNVDGSRFFISGGLNFASVTDTAMSGTYSQSQTVLQADGIGSILNLSSLQSVVFNDNTSFTDTLTVNAANSGVVDLSNISSASSNDILRFLVQSGGSILLMNLNSTNNVNFDIRAGMTQDVNALTQIVGGSVNLDTGATFNATSLTTMQNMSLNAANTAVFNAPALVEVTGSTLNLDAGFTFTSSGLSNITSSRLFVTGGLNFNAVTAASMTGTYSESQAVLKADGTGSVLDLSSLSQLTLNDNTSFDDTLSIIASAGGTILLPKVDTLSTNDGLLVHVQSESTINLSSLQAVGAGRYEFRVEAEGTLLLGDFTVTNNTRFNINDVTSNVVINGSLLLDGPAAFNVATGGGVSVAGNFSFATTDETAFQSDDGILTMNGNGTFANPQYVEVGGQDLGLPGADFGVPADAFDPFVVIGDNGNFNLGKLIVGVDGQPATVVELLDAIDNGNRLSPEALYLPGLGGDGLEIFGGSALNIESINVYAYLDGEWLHLNSLFTGGITQIALSSVVSDPEANGFIVIPEPTTIALFGVAGLLMCRRRW